MKEKYAISLSEIMLDIYISSKRYFRSLEIEQSWLLKHGTDFYYYLDWLHNVFDWDL